MVTFATYRASYDVTCLERTSKYTGETIADPKQ